MGTLQAFSIQLLTTRLLNVSVLITCASLDTLKSLVPLPTVSESRLSEARTVVKTTGLSLK